MSFFSFLGLSKKVDEPTPQSLWDTLDKDYERLESHKSHPTQGNQKKSEIDLWGKLDDYYEKQERKLNNLSVRYSI